MKLKYFTLIALFVFLFSMHDFVLAGDPDTIYTVPSSNSTSFLSDLQQFLKFEDGRERNELFNSVAVSGGNHSTSASLSATPSAMTAYIGGDRITETGAVTYQASNTCYLIADRNTTGNSGAFTRVAGTHYLIDCAGTKPTLPANSIWLMKATTSGSAITAVVDLRNRFTDITTVELIAEATAATRGRLVFNLNDSKMYLDNGSAMVVLASGSGAGSVTSVAMTVPTFLSIGGSPVTTSGTLALTLSGTALPVANGGSGLITYTTGDILYASAATVLSKLPIGTTGLCLKVSGGLPSWGTCVAATGGTVAGTATTAQVAFWDSSSSINGSVNLTYASPALSIGLAGTATGLLKLSGVTSGVITIQGQSAAGTYNFNLPTAAGTSGQPLLSGGGSATAQSYGTLGVAAGGTGLTAGTSGGVLAYTATGTLASSGALTANLPVIGGGAGVAPTVGTRSGNTTAYVTTTGSQTSNAIVKIDASGNYIADSVLTDSGTVLAYTGQMRISGLTVTGSANGKTVGRRDTATGQLYASTSGVACAN